MYQSSYEERGVPEAAGDMRPPLLSPLPLLPGAAFEGVPMGDEAEARRADWEPGGRADGWGRVVCACPRPGRSTTARAPPGPLPAGGAAGGGVARPPGGLGGDSIKLDLTTNKIVDVLPFEIGIFYFQYSNLIKRKYCLSIKW